MENNSIFMIEASVFWIFVVSFLDLFAVSLLIPLMSARLKELGASHFLISCTTSIYALTQLISGPIVGSWSDRIGRQKILFFSLVAVSCCYTFVGLLDSITLILFLRAVLGFVKHTQVLIRTIVTDRVPADRQTSVFAYLKAVAGLSFTLGPAIGGNLAELKHGFSYVCFCVAALFLLSSVVVHLFLKDVQVEKSERDCTVSGEIETPEIRGSILQAIRDLVNVDWPRYWDIFALKFLVVFSMGAFHNNYNIRLREKFDLSPRMAGYTISAQSFVGVLAGFTVDRVNKRFYETDSSYKKRNLHGHVISIIAYLGIIATLRVSIFMMWSMLLKAVHMFLHIVMAEMVIKRCPLSQKGSIIGSSNSVTSIARLITPLLSGYVEDLWGADSSNVLAAIAAIFGLLVSLRLRQQKQKIS